MCVCITRRETFDNRQGRMRELRYRNVWVVGDVGERVETGINGSSPTERGPSHLHPKIREVISGAAAVALLVVKAAATCVSIAKARRGRCLRLHGLGGVAERAARPLVAPPLDKEAADNVLGPSRQALRPWLLRVGRPLILARWHRLRGGGCGGGGSPPQQVGACIRAIGRGIVTQAAAASKDLLLSDALRLVQERRQVSASCDARFVRCPLHPCVVKLCLPQCAVSRV